MKVEKAVKDFKNYAKKHKGINSMVLNGYENSITPYILEEREMNVTQMDVFSRMMKDRIIFLGTGIDDQVANIVTAQILYLESCDVRPIKLYINSPGGSVYSGLAIYDTMQLVKAEVHTICIGMAASMGAILLAGGEAGHRHALSHSRVMIHQPMGGVSSGTQASDMDLTVKEINKLKKELYDILVAHTGQKYSKIEKDSDRDFWLTSSEAVEYKLIDSIYTKKVTAKK